MEISFKGEYLSLKDFECKNMPNFIVITGKNGSGKSQFMDLIKVLEKKIRDNQRILNSDIQLIPSVKRIHSDELTIPFIDSASPENYRNQTKEFFLRYWEILKHKKFSIIYYAFFSKAMPLQVIHDINGDSSTLVNKFKDFLSNIGLNLTNEEILEAGRELGISAPINGGLLRSVRQILMKISDESNIFEISKSVADYQEKEWLELKESDFYNAIIPEKYYQNPDLINSKIEHIFYSYLKKRDSNLKKQFRKITYDEKNNSISKEEFDRTHAKPWDIINDIFSELGLDYKFANIEERDFSENAVVNFDLIKISINKSIRFQYLSSGEKVILGLIIKLFTSQFYEKELQYPDLIVLDEPDAFLHPEMSKLLIEVLGNVFVKKIGIKVIITTHSPSTVALAPDDCIYKISNTPITILEKTSKDEALKILTSGIPNLSIDYKNHRQVFVESPTDLKYYQTIFDKIYAQETLMHKLYFLSNGYGIGNCNVVIKLVSDLRSAGNHTSFGIVDWDNKKTTEEHIFVHGNEVRYSIENFIFDPIYLAIYLLNKRYGKLKAVLDFNDADNEYDLISSDKAQVAVDYLVSELVAKFPTLVTCTDSVNCKYGSSIILKIPKWYLTMNGHELQEKLVNVFEPLQSTKNLHDLETAMVNIIGKVFPNIPEETNLFLKKIANS